MVSRPPVLQRTLQLLDVSFRLEADSPEAFAILHKLFLTPEFDTPVEHDAIHARFHLGTESVTGCRVEVDGRFATLGPGKDAAFLVSEWVFLCLLQASRQFALVHSAAVARHGRGILVVGPPQAGKTTLSVALSALGCEYYSDDVAPLDRDNGALHSFRKSAAVRLQEGTRDYRLPGLRGAAAQSQPPPPCPIGWVFLLEPRPDTVGTPALSSPRLEQVPRDQAALALLQHTMNRLAGGRLSTSYGEHPHLKAYGDIFAALAAAHCYRLTAIQPEATAAALLKMIDEQIQESPPSSDHLSIGATN